MKKKRKGMMGAPLVLALVVGWFIWRSGDSRLLWTRNYGATKVLAALSPKGEMVVAAGQHVEVLNGDGTTKMLLTRPTEILSLVDQFETGFLIVDWNGGYEWLRKYTWTGELQWEKRMDVSLRQIKSSRDGHFAGVIDRKELGLFDPGGRLIWRMSDGNRSYENLGFTSSNTIAYRAHETKDRVQYMSKTLHIVDLEGTAVNDVQLMNPHLVPKVAKSGMIAALEGTNVSLFNPEARHVWTRNKHSSVNPNITASFKHLERLVHVSDRDHVFVEQLNGSISMYEPSGELAWTYADINDMPVQRNTDLPVGEDVLLFVHPDAFLSTTGGRLKPYYFPGHTWIANLNSDGSLKWKHQIRGSRRWVVPYSPESLRLIVTKGALNRGFYPTARPIRDRNGVVYAVGTDGMDSVVHAFRGD